MLRLRHAYESLRDSERLKCIDGDMAIAKGQPMLIKNLSIL